MKCFIFLACVLVFAIGGSAATNAASPAVLQQLEQSGQSVADPQPLLAPADLGLGEVDAFVAPLSDQEVRAVLLAELKSKAASAKAAAETDSQNEFAALLTQRRMATAMLGGRFEAIKNAWDALPERLAFMHLLLTNLSSMQTGLLALLAMIAAGGLAGLLVHRVSRRVCSRWLDQTTESWPVKLALLGTRLVMDLVGIVAFTLVAAAVSFAIFEANDPMRLFTEAYASVVAATLVVWVAARFIFAPLAPQHRLFVMDDRTAVRAVALAVVIALIFSFTRSSVGLVQLLSGGEELVAILRLAVTMVSILIALVFLLTARVDAPGRPILTVWPWLGIAVLALCSVFWILNAVLGARQASMATLLAFVLFLWVPVIDATLRRWLNPRNDTDDARGRVAGTIRRIFITLVLLLAGAFFLQGAGVPLFALLSTPIGSAIVNALGNVVLATVAAAAFWTLFSDWVDRWIERERETALANADTDGLGEGEGGTAIIGTRAQTLLPLFRATVLVVTIAAAALMILSAIGVDIGPLLAGAGVIGLAIGFGAQALVRDVVSGVFFLIDDAFRVGEYLEIGELRGEVEKISVRSMQLRHHRGMVQTIPFGELRHITNYSRDWVIYKQDFLVPFDTDIEKVRKLIKKLGQEMLANPDYGHLFIEPMKSQGVTRIEEAGMVVRTKFTCKPRQQFLLRRYVNLNIQRLFHENGIEFARRRIQVEGTHGPVSPDEAASAAQSILGQEAAGAKAAGA